MTKIESKKVEVPADKAKITAFLSDMNNIEKLLPEGKYSHWKSDGSSCSFKVQNAYEIGLKFISADDSGIRYESTPGSPFPFHLNIQMQDKGNSTEGQLFCEAQINPFLEMLVKGPLKNLFDYMADKLTSQFPSA